MIAEFVTLFDKNRGNIYSDFLERLNTGWEPTYLDMLKILLHYLQPNQNGYGDPDPDRITTIDHGEYQGTLVFVIAENGYKPSRYWSTYVDYGSCTGCDTLLDIQYNVEDNETKAQDLLTLTLHMLQRMVKLT